MIYNFDGDYYNPSPKPKPILYYYPDFGVTSILPFPLIGTSPDIINGDYSLLPNSYSLTGLLKKISYPTGGFSMFEYENHKFQYAGKADYLSGGARLKKQTINDGEDDRILNYSYKNINNFTTGYVNNIPVFGYPSNYDYNDITVFDKNRGGLELTNGAFVGYSKVIEYEEGNGRKEYEFSSPKDFHNIYETRVIGNTSGTNTTCYNFLLDNSAYPNLNYIDKDILRGRLMKKNIFNQDDFLLINKEYEYEYKLFDEFDLSYITKVYTEEVPVSQEKEYFEIEATSTINIERNTLSKETITEYFENGAEKTTIKDYTYDANYPLIKESVITDDLGQRKTKIYYAFDPEVSGDPYMGDLVDANRISEPIKMESYKDGALLSTKKYNYARFGSIVIDKKSISTALAPNALEEGSVIISRDNNGNITQYQGLDGERHFLVWGYNKNYVIAKIDNLSYSDYVSNISLINNAIQLSDSDDDTCVGTTNCAEKSLRTALNTLRTTFVSSMVTTYTYDPLVGVTSITQPNGETLYYKYDNFNRLEYVVNSEGKILKENEYHYKD